MLDLALRQQSGPVALSAIGKRHQISVSYLEQLFARLRRAGLVTAVRGPGGGYVLDREATDITVADIVASVDDGPAPGEPAEDMLTRDLWANVGDRLASYLSSITLAQLTAEQVAKGVKVEPVQPAKSGVSPRSPIKPMKITAPNSVFALAAAFAK
jgi:Rrf2 family iron-sulfur cluster assembly transcriptional regulator